MVTVLADSSAWIEFFRKTGSPVHMALADAIRRDEVATTDVVILEVLTGAARTHFDQIRRLMQTRHYLAQEPFADVTFAVDLYRNCRSRGHTPRGVNDCLIAAVAIRNEVPVLELDKDFEILARYSPLELASR